jgi:hypothetical protein
MFLSFGPPLVTHKTYELVCQLSPSTALERIKALLSSEWVEYRTADLSVTSTRTPIIFFNFDPRLRSRNNWVGVNPFVCVSGSDVRCEPGGNGLTKVIVCINRFRAVFFLAWWVVLSLVAVFSMTEPAGALFFVGSTCAAWFGMVSFLGGYLIKKEIDDQLLQLHDDKET